MTVTSRPVANDFTPAVHVYEPHRAGLPPLRPYFRELWRRREFIIEMSRATMRAANTATFFGQAWLVINPLLLAAVYFVLVDILSGQALGAEYFAHLIGGLFVFYYVQGCIMTGAASVVGGGKLLLNMSFPRLLLPISAVRTAFFRFIPTLVVYFIVHLVAGLPVKPVMLLAVVFLFMLTLFGAGLGALFAALQVYFRDTSSFLPYFMRIWLYVSPVLWLPEMVPDGLRSLMFLNPLYYLIGGWSELLVAARMPTIDLWVGSVVWSLAALVFGSLFFMSREREFAVRI